jgi:pyruvate/2-oxoglutarate dehydrogenase complex dihydrolipoamide acyltransferase (E2) component
MSDLSRVGPKGYSHGWIKEGMHVRVTSGYHGGKEGHVVSQDGGNVKIRDASGGEFLTGAHVVEPTGKPGITVTPHAPAGKPLTAADVKPGMKVHLPGGRIGTIIKIQTGPHGIPGANVQYPRNGDWTEGYAPHWHPLDGLKLAKAAQRGMGLTGMADTWAATWTASWAAEAQRFNMTHAPAGASTGGQFASSGGGGAPAKTAPKAAAAKPAAKTAHPATAVIKARKAHLHERAAADRAQARKLGTELHVLQAQEAHAHAAAVKAAAAAKKAHHAAAAKPVSAKVAAARKAAAAHRKARGHHATLKQRISGLQQRIGTLNTQAKQLDAQAAAL